MAAEFISTRPGITYKVPEGDKFARFSSGRFATGDEQTISYLREHPDYGTTLTEVENPTRRVAVNPGVYICEYCGKVFKNAARYTTHYPGCKLKKESKGVEVNGDGND